MLVQVPIAACGDTLIDPAQVTGDDGVVYLQGSNGFWLPTTSRNRQTVVMTKSTFVDLDSQPCAPPAQQEAALPPEWSRYQTKRMLSRMGHID